MRGSRVRVTQAAPSPELPKVAEDGHFSILQMQNGMDFGGVYGAVVTVYGFRNNSNEFTGIQGTATKTSSAYVGSSAKQNTEDGNLLNAAAI
jgi:hypothetical protein